MEKGRWPQVSGWREMGRGDLALAPLAKKGGFPLGKARCGMERALEVAPFTSSTMPGFPGHVFAFRR